MTGHTSTTKHVSAGFTLLELVIAISILSVMMIFSNQSIQNALRAKLKIQDQLEDMSAVRDSLRVIERDLNLAYHYRDLETELKQQVLRSGKSGPAPGAPPAAPPSDPNAATASQNLQAALNQWNRTDPTRQDPTTHFVGASDELHFITMNSARLSEEVAQADFIKVGYRLTSCRKPGSTGGTSKCLLRSSSPLVEGDILQNGPSSILLENVTEFKLRYIGASKQDWVSDWNSKTGDAGTKDNFPDAVEVSITITKGEGSKKKKVSMQIIAPIRFPNNPPPTAQTAPGGP